eukprot:PhM_4_TR4979/c0_g1_i1/m.2862
MSASPTVDYEARIEIEKMKSNYETRIAKLRDTIADKDATTKKLQERVAELERQMKDVENASSTGGLITGFFQRKVDRVMQALRLFDSDLHAAVADYIEEVQDTAQLQEQLFEDVRAIRRRHEAKVNLARQPSLRSQSIFNDPDHRTHHNNASFYRGSVRRASMSQHEQTAPEKAMGDLYHSHRSHHPKKSVLGQSSSVVSTAPDSSLTMQPRPPSRARSLADELLGGENKYKNEITRLRIELAELRASESDARRDLNRMIVHKLKALGRLGSRKQAPQPKADRDPRQPPPTPQTATTSGYVPTLEDTFRTVSTAYTPASAPFSALSPNLMTFGSVKATPFADIALMGSAPVGTRMPVLNIPSVDPTAGANTTNVTLPLLPKVSSVQHQLHVQKYARQATAREKIVERLIFGTKEGRAMLMEEMRTGGMVFAPTSPPMQRSAGGAPARTPADPDLEGAARGKEGKKNNNNTPMKKKKHVRSVRGGLEEGGVGDSDDDDDDEHAVTSPKEQQNINLNTDDDGHLDPSSAYRLLVASFCADLHVLVHRFNEIKDVLSEESDRLQQYMAHALGLCGEPRRHPTLSFVKLTELDLREHHAPTFPDDPAARCVAALSGDHDKNAFNDDVAFLKQVYDTLAENLSQNISSQMYLLGKLFERVQLKVGLLEVRSEDAMRTTGGLGDSSNDAVPRGGISPFASTPN